MPEEKQKQPDEWSIIIDQFNGFVPSWYKNGWPSFGMKEQAADMYNIDLIDPNCMKPGPGPKNLINGDQDGAVTTLIKSFMRQVISDNISYAIGGDYLYQLSATEVMNEGDFPHNIDIEGADGEDVIYYKGLVLYFYNIGTTNGDIGIYDVGGTSFDDDWGSTVPEGAMNIEYAPHQIINAGDDEVYFANGRYVGKISYSSKTGLYTLNTQALDFWTDGEVVSLAWNENRVKVALNRPNIVGANMNLSGIYNWNGYSSSQEGDPIEIKGRIGALYTKNGVDYVWWQDTGSIDEFNFGYILGMQVQILKKCKGILPSYYQVGEHKGFIAWISDGLVYLYGQSDPDAPVKFFQYTNAKY